MLPFDLSDTRDGARAGLLEALGYGSECFGIADKNGKVLSGAYPAIALSVSAVEGGPKWVKSFVQAVIEAKPDKPPQFILNVSGETFTVTRRC